MFVDTIPCEETKGRRRTAKGERHSALVLFFFFCQCLSKKIERSPIKSFLNAEKPRQVTLEKRERVSFSVESDSFQICHQG